MESNVRIWQHDPEEWLVSEDEVFIFKICHISVQICNRLIEDYYLLYFYKSGYLCYTSPYKQFFFRNWRNQFVKIPSLLATSEFSYVVTAKTAPTSMDKIIWSCFIKHLLVFVDLLLLRRVFFRCFFQIPVNQTILVSFCDSSEV